MKRRTDCESCINADLGCNKKELDLCRIHGWRLPKRNKSCICGKKSFSYFHVITNVYTKSNEVGKAESRTKSKLVYECDNCHAVYVSDTGQEESNEI